VSALLAASTETYARLYIWLTVLLVAVIVLGVAVWYARRWALSKPSSGTGQGWTLAELRELRQAGEVSEEEYEKLRTQIIGAVRRRVSESQTPGHNEDPSTAPTDGDLR
jgi:hypothetical protein